MLRHLKRLTGLVRATASLLTGSGKAQTARQRFQIAMDEHSASLLHPWRKLGALPPRLQRLSSGVLVYRSASPGRIEVLRTLALPEDARTPIRQLDQGVARTAAGLIPSAAMLRLKPAANDNCVVSGDRPEGVRLIRGS